MNFQYCYCQINNSDDLKFLFYNVENLFDNKDDSLSNDQEFLPLGDRSWTWEKYNNKCSKISKVILSSCDWNIPDLIALCEIENRFVLNGLLEYTPMHFFEYKIVHRESQDHRGIDVALFYRPAKMKLLKVNFISLNIGDDPVLRTREILYCKFLLARKDSLHIFVNHWPSKWGGKLETEYKRLKAASVLRSKLDSILEKCPNEKIICVGDFNDTPDDKSIKTILKAVDVDQELLDDRMYNLSKTSKNSFQGTYKYRANWYFLDQFIVSSSLLKSTKGVYCLKDDMSVIEKAFLFEDDYKYMGLKPYRTFIGFKYRNAFSDHLPIVLRLRIKN